MRKSSLRAHLRQADTTKRFRDGYNYFVRNPERIIAFFDKHMKSEQAATVKRDAA